MSVAEVPAGEAVRLAELPAYGEGLTVSTAGAAALVRLAQTTATEAA